MKRSVSYGQMSTRMPLGYQSPEIKMVPLPSYPTVCRRPRAAHGAHGQKDDGSSSSAGANRVHWQQTWPRGRRSTTNGAKERIESTGLSHGLFARCLRFEGSG